MKASEIMFDETLPHGTVDGYKAGCKGSHCMGTELLGMSCRQASIRYAADYSYRRRIDGGLSPEAIYAEDQLEQVAVPAITDLHPLLTTSVTEPSLTVAHSQTPVKLADFGDDVPEPSPVVRPAKWRVARLWVAVSPTGVLHGPFTDHGEGIGFVDSHLLRLATAAAPAPTAGPSKRSWNRFTDEDRANLRELHAEGLTDKQIADRLDRGQSVVSSHRRQMGLSANGERVAATARVHG